MNGYLAFWSRKGHPRNIEKNWARLIQKIYEVDPLTCPKCQGRMKIISFIEDEELIEKILKHLGLWDFKARPPPKVKASSLTISIDDSDSHVNRRGQQTGTGTTDVKNNTLQICKCMAVNRHASPGMWVSDLFIDIRDS